MPLFQLCKRVHAASEHACQRLSSCGPLGTTSCGQAFAPAGRQRRRRKVVGRCGQEDKRVLGHAQLRTLQGEEHEVHRPAAVPVVLRRGAEQRRHDDFLARNKTEFGYQALNWES